MVVGIYSLPDAVSPKRRCSEGSANLLPCRAHKRWKQANADETAVILEATEAQEPSSSVVLFEENSGIWHVDGLLELLAGALCATFGADPASLDMTRAPECASTSPRGSPDANATAEQKNKKNISEPLHPQTNQLRDQLQQRTSPTALTEVNLRAHTAWTQPSAAAAASSPRPTCPDDEDRSSVASLSAWVMGTQSPRRRGSEGGAQQGLASGAAQQLALTSGPPSASVFSFPRRWSAGGGGGGCGGSISADGGAVTDSSEPRWPRRRLPAAARW